MAEMCAAPPATPAASPTVGTLATVKKYKKRAHTQKNFRTSFPRNSWNCLAMVALFAGALIMGTVRPDIALASTTSTTLTTLAPISSNHSTDMGADGNLGGAAGEKDHEGHPSGIAKTCGHGIEICPKNTFSIGAYSTCTDCAEGGHATPGSSTCETCSTGTYFKEDENIYFDCPSGTATATGGVGVDECIKCQEGFFSSSPGSSTCFACEAGKYANTAQTERLFCPAGKTSGVASSSCSVCEDEKFAHLKKN
ncbi:hypothetical protein TL16_g03536 [Triparma laevis f. inornata]|uniref:Tyrosine-protein kinase ephrin type A/B receptor-like domain-containing protein n=2 Tax=Triparma laevis TaxID=1534972 RepID=A0A9W7CME5_9STRA|nr:hypothetical protein TL16_g03536 [Triparma laevis f. inornata]GMI07246.1 hypothetical protein TrLO_g6081 [Triparma laevis f. longispina]